MLPGYKILLKAFTEKKRLLHEHLSGIRNIMSSKKKEKIKLWLKIPVLVSTNTA